VHNGHLPVGYSVWNVTVGLARTIFYSFLKTGQRDEQPSSEVAVDSVEKGSGTLLLGALCESVALSPYSLTGFVLQCNIYTVHVRYFWQEIHRLYGHTQCIYTVLVNANCEPCQKSRPGLVRAVPGISSTPSHARICIMHQHL
jgi:hypothetical protein